MKTYPIINSNNSTGFAAFKSIVSLRTLWDFKASVLSLILTWMLEDSPLNRAFPFNLVWEIDWWISCCIFKFRKRGGATEFSNFKDRQGLENQLISACLVVCEAQIVGDRKAGTFEEKKLTIALVYNSLINSVGVHSISSHVSQSTIHRRTGLTPTWLRG